MCASVCLFAGLRVEFSLKTDGGYPREAGVFFHSQWQTLGVPFKVGLGISRTNADSHWNPVYKAFHPNVCCRNEMIRW